MRILPGFSLLWPTAILIFLLTSPAILKAAQVLLPATISGQVQGFPAQSGTVVFFSEANGPTPDQRTFNRVPDILATIDSANKFAVKVSPGQYYLGFLNSSDVPPLSTLNSHDLFFLGVDPKNQLLKINAPPGSKINLGKISFKARSTDKSSSGFFSVSGHLTTEKNKPVKGYVVLAKIDFNDIRPSYASEPTAEDGLFQIMLPPGTYSLIARPRTITFGRPQIGELFGVYGENKPVGTGGVLNPARRPSQAVTGTAGESIGGINIILFPIPDPEKKREELGG